MSELDQHAQPIETRLAAIASDGYVSADEVLFLRRNIFADGVVSPHELDALFALGDRAPDGDPEWPQFFAEAVADFYLREEEPQGYLTEVEFQSLRERVMRNGSANRLERMLLVKLMETATKTPPDMSAFTGDQIKAAILTRPTPAVHKEDVLLLRRWLFAAGGDGNVAVTRAEAEVLFDINDVVKLNENSAGWSELFTQGIINHLMASLGYSAASRAEAMRRHAFISDHSIQVGGFFQKMAASVLDAVSGAGGKDKSQTVYAERAELRDAATAGAEAVTAAEASWLADRIGRDGAFDENERRVIERMIELKADLPEALSALIERAA